MLYYDHLLCALSLSLSAKQRLLEAPLPCWTEGGVLNCQSPLWTFPEPLSCLHRLIHLKRCGHGTRPCGVPKLLSTLAQSQYSHLPRLDSKNQPLGFLSTTTSHISQGGVCPVQQVHWRQCHPRGQIPQNLNTSTHLPASLATPFNPHSPQSLSLCLLFFSAHPSVFYSSPSVLICHSFRSLTSQLCCTHVCTTKDEKTTTKNTKK